MSVKFNYIITIHNKEELILKVLGGVKACCGLDSSIYAVLDGCTDGTEQKIDEFINQNPSVNLIKVYAPDVHELKSINIGLLAAEQQGNVFNIILQDDVVLQDSMWEEKVVNLYSKISGLGIVSFRHGGNLSRKVLKHKNYLNPLIHYRESVWGHQPNWFNYLQSGSFVFKEIAIKSPICIPSFVIKEIGLPDEMFAPWNDIDYCYQALLAGFKNGVYALKFDSKVEWGTTRTKKQNVALMNVEMSGMEMFKKKYERTFIPLNRQTYNNKLVYIGTEESSSAIPHLNSRLIKQEWRVRYKRFISLYIK